MIANAILWITRPELALQRVGGLSVLERQLWTARRAGLKKVWVGLRRPDDKALAALRLPADLELLWTQRMSEAQTQCEPPYLVLSGDHFVRAESLAYVARAPYKDHAALEDAAGASVIQIAPFSADKVPVPQKQRLPEGSSIRLDKNPRVEGVLLWLLASGTKSQDGFMARNFDRHISLAISRLLLDTGVTPNMMTVLSTAIGLVGAALLAVPGHATRLGGAALIWLHSVVDGCDGELARIRFQESPLGADLDFWGDNLVHLALFSCLAWGFFSEGRGALPLVLGAAAVAGSLGSAALAYRKRLARRRGEAEAAPAEGLDASLSRLEELLAARDFIYLLLVLALFDLSYLFLWASALGSIPFFVMTTYLGRVKNEQASQPHPPRQGEARSPAAGDGSGHQHLHSRR